MNDIDVLIVGRGGGSIEDLWAFNEEVVARAISASKIPIVSAVGHEIDYTIADFVADLRAPTPSAAAELTVPALNTITQELRRLTERLLEVLYNRIGGHKELLGRLIKRRFFNEPMQILEPHTQRLDDLNARLLRGLDQWVVLQRQKLIGRVQQLLHLSPEKLVWQLQEKMESFHHRLGQNIISIVRLEQKRFDGAVKSLHALSPLSILDRGYSITTFDGKALTQSGRVQEGDSVNVRLAKGSLECTVDKALSQKREGNEES
jgi:exodeoxyribonuclease VII large subunit